MQTHEEGFEPLRIQGYAAVYNVTYKKARGYERIVPGAFEIGSAFACWDHDIDRPIGSTEDGSLRLFQDDYGLGFDLVVPSNRSGLWLANAVGRGELRQASFNHVGYAHPEIRFEDGREVKVCKHLVLEEISICERGANPETCVWLNIEIMDELPSNIGAIKAKWEMSYEQTQTVRRLNPRKVDNRVSGKSLADIYRAKARAKSLGLIA